MEPDDVPWTPARTVDLVSRILRHLAPVHEAGEAHGALSPASVTADGRPEPAEIAPPSFTAPERREGGPATPEADVYAVAALMFHLVTGHTPVDLHLAEPDSPRWDNVPQPLRGLVQAGVCADPASRPTPVDLRAQLAALDVTGLPVASTPRPPPDMAVVVADVSRRPTDMEAVPAGLPGRWLIGLALVLVVGVGIGGAWLGPLGVVEQFAEVRQPVVPTGHWAGHLDATQPIDIGFAARADGSVTAAVTVGGRTWDLVASPDRTTRFTDGATVLRLEPHEALPRVRHGTLTRSGTPLMSVVVVWVGPAISASEP